MADTTVSYQFDTAPGLTPAKDRDEEEGLLAGLLRAEEAAYEVLILRYEQPVYNLVSRLVDDSADAADVVQEVFLKVFRKVGSFRGESSLKTWIYRIAVNEARNQRRWFGRHKRREICLEPAADEHLQGDWLEDPGPSPFELTLDHETTRLIEETLRNVNPAYRAALVLREIEGLSYEEISEILEVSLGTVKSRILRGRDALRKGVTERLQPAHAAGFACAPRVEEAM